LNLPSVISDTYLEIVSHAPQMVSSDFGQLAVNRQRMSGADLNGPGGRGFHGLSAVS